MTDKQKVIDAFIRIVQKSRSNMAESDTLQLLDVLDYWYLQEKMIERLMVHAYAETEPEGIDLLVSNLTHLVNYHRDLRIMALFLGVSDLFPEPVEDC